MLDISCFSWIYHQAQIGSALLFKQRNLCKTTKWK